MKKIFILILLFALAAVMLQAEAARPVHHPEMTKARAKMLAARTARQMEKEGWVTTVTTNEDGTTNKVVTKGDITVTMTYHNTPVPMQYRTRFHLMNEEEKGNALAAAITNVKRTELTPATPIHVKRVEKVKTDDNITEEVYIINAR